MAAEPCRLGAHRINVDFGCELKPGRASVRSRIMNREQLLGE